ncbi:unnamed protein product [Mytilus edulis]|uniref:Uncharacterized protein n=1 Tax=Mytilus edulis TaxID=6550 RepID=A0A8S3SCS0_MYTED|nr:unnamed protein product [Mytilus edulis]
MNSTEWQYVSTNNNPADKGTRGVQASEMSNSLRITGPQFLLKDATDHTGNFTLQNPDVDKELRPDVLSFKTDIEFSQQLGTDRFSRFSLWKTLIKSIARLNHVAQSFASKSSCTGWHICSESASVNAIDEARKLVLREAQIDTFSDEIDCLSTRKPLAKSSSIASLAPFLDKENMLRIGGRIQNSHELSHQGRHITEERENSMEVDLPVSHSHGQGNTNLKRSNSAPMINVLVNTTQSPPEISHHSHTQTFRQAGDTSRIRRFSSSSLSLNSPIAAPVKIPNRVNEIKREESFVTVAEKEKEQESFYHTSYWNDVLRTYWMSFSVIYANKVLTFYNLLVIWLFTLETAQGKTAFITLQMPCAVSRDICSQLKMSTSWNDFSLVSVENSRNYYSLVSVDNSWNDFSLVSVDNSWNDFSLVSVDNSWNDFSLVSVDNSWNDFSLVGVENSWNDFSFVKVDNSWNDFYLVSVDNSWNDFSLVIVDNSWNDFSLVSVDNS